MPFFKNRRALIAILGISLIAVAYVALSPDRYSKRVRASVKRQLLILTGGLVDVGGYHVRIECSGSGGPTVVFDGGLSQPRATWGSVPGEVAKFARVCTYDRAGVGESDRAPFVRTSADAVRELRTLLEKTDESGPFVLVGHSFGGQNVRLFASVYPDEVAGLVLVDPSHEDQYQMIADSLPSEEAKQFLSHEAGNNDEKMDLLASAIQVRSAARNSDVPAVLLSADPEAESGDPPHHAMPELHAKMIGLYPNGRLIRLSNTGHFIQVEQPETLFQAIEQIVKTPPR